MAESLAIIHADLFTLQPSPTPAGRVPEATIVMRDGKIAWVGPDGHAPKNVTRTIDARGRVVTPGWIEPHTHLVFAGERSRDYRRRAEGVSYKQIAAEGGGILSTVRATRAASEEALVALALPRLQSFLERGVTTLETKSGYGLTLEDERKLLRVAKTLGEKQPISIESTWMPAHAVPPEMDADRWVDAIVEETPRIASGKLARFADVFVESGFFSVEQGRRVLDAAVKHGLLPRIHADQMSDGGGAELAASLKCVSADHLEKASDRGLEALAKAGTVAVLAPAAALFLGDEILRADRFKKAGVTVALSTDFNPGTSPTDDLAMVGTLAMSRMGMTSEEALESVTIHAARAIARPDLGMLFPGSEADLVLWDAPSLEHLFWHFGERHAAMVIKKGAIVFEKDASPRCRPGWPPP